MKQGENFRFLILMIIFAPHMRLMMVATSSAYI